MSPSAPPPSPQEVHRKLSLHSRPPARRQSYGGSPSQSQQTQPVSGTESDSDSVLTPDMASISSHPHGGVFLPSVTSAMHGVTLAGSSSQPPLSSIAERRSGSGEESEDEEDEEGAGGWRAGTVSEKEKQRASVDEADEAVIKAGYLWKKGERRKTWKKRWFVLRPAHIAYYKSSAEYQLLRLLELADVHSCTPCVLKNHDNTFGLVSAARTYYLQAKTAGEVGEWVKAIQEARVDLTMGEGESIVGTQGAIAGSSAPITIPAARSRSGSQATPADPHSYHSQGILTSSESEDGSPHVSPQLPPTRASLQVSPGRGDATKTIVAGYLMKCGSKRKSWRKRWFMLSGEKLVYSASHMDTKPHRQFSVADILDALEYTLTSNPPLPDGEHGFKIVTTKRALVLCAPSEEEEIKWLSAVRALIARRSVGGEQR